MDLGPLRGLALDAVFSAHGVPARVTRPDLLPIDTRVLWAPEPQEHTGLEFTRVVSRRVMALRVSEVPAVPVGTIVTAPDAAGKAVMTWRVDELDQRQEPELIRVLVQPMRTSAELEAWGKS